MSRRDRNEKAAEYFRRAPGYSAEAIPDIMAQAVACKDRYPGTATALWEMATCLEVAHKFALPEGGLLFSETTAAMQETWRPPFDWTAFEWDASSKKRIALCVATKDQAVIHKVCKIDGVWTPDPFAIGFALNEDRLAPFVFTCGPCETGIALLALGEVGVELLGGLGREARREKVLDSLGRTISVVMQACAALSCTNVTTEVIRPNREAHAIKPASTLFDYHVLVLKPGASHDPSTPGDGTHASPRTHLRRGHIRRHPTAGRIWVNSCVVNPGAIGSVNKDYAVMPGRQRP